LIFGQPLPFVRKYIETVNEAIAKHNPDDNLSSSQRYWLGLCIMGILVTNSVCWARFERACLGKYSLAALSWMFRHSNIKWDLLLVYSTIVILRFHGIQGGTLVIDDSDKGRSKVAPMIAWLHKLKDKSSGGFINGQNMVFLILVTPLITIPVGFSFYMPDPKLTECYSAQIN